MSGPFLIQMADGQSWPCDGDESVLVSMRRANVEPIFFGCREGGCGACRVHINNGRYRSGKVSRSHVSEAEQAEGYALACRLYPESDLVLTAARVKATAGYRS